MEFDLTACEAFFDPSSFAEEASVADEFRLAVIGMTEQFHLLYVVHIERESQQLRIVSAREATAKERRLYEEGE